jgi:hypothetical protein
MAIALPLLLIAFMEWRRGRLTGTGGRWPPALRRLVQVAAVGDYALYQRRDPGTPDQDQRGVSPSERR